MSTYTIVTRVNGSVASKLSVAVPDHAVYAVMESAARALTLGKHDECRVTARNGRGIVTHTLNVK